MKWQRFFMILAILGVIQFIVLTTVAMWYYPGTTIHNRSTEGYLFFQNFFSDLGRTYTFNRTPNLKSHYLFQTALTLTGISLSLFFLTVPSLFQNKRAKWLGVFAMLTGLLAALAYIGIAFTPYNMYYRAHTFFVRTGFIAFLATIFFYVLAIFSDPAYPNKYAKAFLVFGAILAIQIAIMIFGPRSWQSPNALLLQAISQKIIVYGQISCMLYQAIGAWRRV